MKRLAFCLMLAVIILLISLRLLLVGAFAAKVLDKSAYLDAWKGEVSRRSETMNGIFADIYDRTEGRFPVILVHGVNPTGKDSPDIVRVAEAFAQVGFKVIAPDFPRMKRQNVSSKDSDDLRAVVGAVEGDVGMVCISYGCGPALIAAASDGIRDRVRFIVTFAGYFDMVSQLRYIVTTTNNPLGYDKWTYAAANATQIGSDSDRYWEMFGATTNDEFERRFAALPADVSARIRSISPSRTISRLRARLIIVHGENDPCIPTSESLDLAAAAANLGIEHDLFVFHIYGHTRPDLPAVSWTTLKETYLPEGFKLLRLANAVLSQR